MEALPDHSFTLFTQPPRNFPWRAVGNSLSYRYELEERAADFDLLLATSMVDLAGLKGLSPSVAQLPSVVYFHENQFAYPRLHTRDHSHLLLINLYTLLAADQGLFNSEYNRGSYLQGLDRFLRLMPDMVPPGVVEEVAAKSQVIPVGMEDHLFDDAADPLLPPPDDGALRILWNHRWEHDKAPERFFEALFQLQARGVPFRLAVVGQRFRSAPPIFARAREVLKDRIDQWGYLEEEGDYLRLLDSCDLVVSTALHEFQGLAVQEAVLRGCRPVLPDRLAYREFFADAYRYPSTPEDEGAEVDALVQTLEELCASPELVEPGGSRRASSADAGLQGLAWDVLAPRYAEVFRQTVAAKRP